MQAFSRIGKTLRALSPDALAQLALAVACLFYTYLFFGTTQIGVDIGRDFLVPDLMLRGKVLYRDIVYWFGPLAPTLHWALFRAFGPSFEIIFAAGCVAGVAIVFLTYWIARRILSPAVALTAALIVLTHGVFGGSIHNYATPYTYSATYGLLCALLTIYAGQRLMAEGSLRWPLFAGGAAGAALLSKQEFGLAAAAVLAAALLFGARAGGAWRLIAAAAGGYGLTCAAAAAVLFAFVTPAEFLAGYLPRESMRLLAHFYGVSLGWADPATSLIEAHRGLVLNLGFVLGAAGLVALTAARLSGEGISWPRAAILLIVAAPFLWVRQYLWFYPPTIALAVAGWEMARGTRPDRRQVFFVAVAAVALSWRVWVRPDIRWYGLPYFVPLLIVYLYLCFELIAPHLGRLGGARFVRPALIGVLLTCFVAFHFYASDLPYLRQAEALASSRGVVRVPPEEAQRTRRLVEQIRRRTAPADPILVIPEGVMIYFLAERVPASRYLNYTYATLPDGAAERREIRELEAAPPALIVLGTGDNNYYLPGPETRFGRAYDQRLYGWIEANYVDVADAPADLAPLRFLVKRDGRR